MNRTPSDSNPFPVHPVFPWLTPARRVWLYGVIAALQPLIVAYGIAEEQNAAFIINAVLAVVGSGVAIPHTPTEG